MRLRVLAGAVLAALSGAAGETSSTPAGIEALVRELGDAEISVRERAFNALLDKAAEDSPPAGLQQALEAGKESPDPEVAEKVAEVLAFHGLVQRVRSEVEDLALRGFLLERFRKEPAGSFVVARCVRLEGEKRTPVEGAIVTAKVCASRDEKKMGKIEEWRSSKSAPGGFLVFPAHAKSYHVFPGTWLDWERLVQIESPFPESVLLWRLPERFVVNRYKILPDLELVLPVEWADGGIQKAKAVQDALIRWKKVPGTARLDVSLRFVPSYSIQMTHYVGREGVEEDGIPGKLILDTIPSSVPFYKDRYPTFRGPSEIEVRLALLDAKGRLLTTSQKPFRLMMQEE